MGSCLSFTNKNQILIAGLENSGKSFFLYARLKNFITGKPHIRTRPTLSFNFEEITIGTHNVIFWDLPGKENLRQFWPIFYRKIKFTGIIYLIDYFNKDTLNESIRVLHDLLNEPELSSCHVLIVINMEKKISIDDEYQFRKNKVDENENDKDLDDSDEELKMIVHFDLLPNQDNVKFHRINLYEEKSSSEQYNKVKEKMKIWLSTFS